MIVLGLFSQINILFRLSLLEPIPVAAQSNASIYGLSLAGIASSNPAGDIDVCLLCVLCFQIDVSLSGWSLFQMILTDCGVSECDHDR